MCLVLDFRLSKLMQTYIRDFKREGKRRNILKKGKTISKTHKGKKKKVINNSVKTKYMQLKCKYLNLSLRFYRIFPQELTQLQL